MTVVSLGLADRGRTVSVNRGDRIVLSLPENASTGFRWSADVPGFLRVERDENESAAAPGGAGVRVMELLADAEGSAELRLRYVREWEPDRPAERFAVTVLAS